MAVRRTDTILPFLLIAVSLINYTASQCTNPEHMRGSFFSMETLTPEVHTEINPRNIENEDFQGECVERLDINRTNDAENRHDSKILYYDSAQSKCYKCYYLIYRTPNIIQYKMSGCITRSTQPPLEEVCGSIPVTSDLFTFFRINLERVNCKNTFEGVYQFAYEWNVGGGGVCNTSRSEIVACQIPGSQYVDNEVFNMYFAKCPGVSSSNELSIRFICMGSWTDETGKKWSGIANDGEEVYRNRFRCMLTELGQEGLGNVERHTLSWWADCSELKSSYNGPVRLQTRPVVGGFQALYQPTCNFPTNFTGHWFHTGELDVDVDINATHMYFNTKLDQFYRQESYFVCLMNSGTRYMTIAITVGKCEIDYVCFDMLPRHHSIIRWRMGKPYRLTATEQGYSNFELYMFQQACSWYSFTLDRNDINWNYKTFLLNPPSPIPCPIRGRYIFNQKGPETELIKTRIQGITERPRHLIDCDHYITEWKSCDNNPTKISLDAEYCETVDHTGRPVGEYDEPDWELSCVGYWDEDWRSYMVTWDREDPTSAFRCWVYERQDWRFIQVSRSTTAFCYPYQTAYSEDPKEGGSLSMALTEAERLFDDCAQTFEHGHPWETEVDIYYDDGSAAVTHTPTLISITTSLAFAIFFSRFL